MKTAVIAMLAIQFLASSASASEECNLILSDHISASIQNLAQLRYDLDSQLANGKSNLISHTLSAAFNQKRTDLLKHGASTGLAVELLDQKIRDQIKTISNPEMTSRLDPKSLEREALDQHTGSIKMKGLIEPRLHASVYQVSDHQILFTSGSVRNGPWERLNSVELYNVRTGESEVIGQLSASRGAPHLQIFQNGKVFAWGGEDLNGSRKQAEWIDLTNKKVASTQFKFDRSTESFGMADGRILQIRPLDDWYLTALNVEDGTSKDYSLGDLSSDYTLEVSQQPDKSVVMIVSSDRPAKDFRYQLIKIDGSSLQVSVSIKLDQAISKHAQLGLSNDRIIVSGGYRAEPGQALLASDRVEQLEVATGKMTLLGRLSAPRVGHRMIRLTDHEVMILGGYSKSEQTKDLQTTIEIFNLDTGVTEVLDHTLMNANQVIAFPTEKGVLLIHNDVSEAEIELLNVNVEPMK